MRIGIVTKSDVLALGGIEKVAFNLAKYAPHRYTVIILDTKKGYRNKVRKVEELGDIYRISGKNIRIFHDDTFYGFIINSIISFIITKEVRKEAEKCDLLYFTTNILSFAFRKRREQIFVGSTHGIFYIKDNSVWNALNKLTGFFAYRKLDAIHELAKGQSKDLGLASCRRFVVPNGIDTNLFKPNRSGVNHSERNYNFLFVGRLEECKGLKIAVESFRRADSAAIHKLRIVGDGPLRGWILENQSENVMYIGAASEDELAGIYSQSDVLLTPTTCDAFSLVVLEALSSGLHVIASEILKPIWEENAQSVEIEFVPPEVESFRYAIDRLINEGRGWDRLKQHQYIREHFDIEVVTARLFDEMRKVCEEKHG